jgi:hypothetical protein
MTVKLNHYWAIKPEKKKQYGKFIINEFVPGVNKLGLHTVAGWSVVVGAYSEIIFETVANDLDLLERALRNPRYQQLKVSLFKYIKKYKTKVLVNTDKKNTYSTDIQEDTVKFNQMWDVLSDHTDEFDRFTKDSFYPALESLGITVAQEWEVLIGDGPHIICEGRVDNVSNLITSLQSKEFREAKQTLRNYVENYESRILSFHIQKVKGYKSASYNIIGD